MARLTPNVYLEVRLAKYPASLGTTIYRWARRPMADPSSWKEQRLISLSPIERRASDLDGNYFTSTVTAVLNDQDGVLRGLLEAGTSTEYMTAREVSIFLISDTGRAASTTPRPIFRGFIADIQALPDRQVELQIVDVIGSQFSAFNLDKTIPDVFIRDIKPDVHEDLRDISVNIYAGEFSDLTARDENGNNVEKGLVPVFDLGDYDITGEPAESTAPPVAAPYDLSAEIIGAGGSEHYYYWASVITPYGESVVSARLSVTGAPAESQLGLSNYVKIRGKFNRGASNENKIRIWGRNYTTPTKYLDEAFYSGSGAGADFFYNDGSHPAPTPTREDVDHEKPLAEPTGIADDGSWMRALICLGYGYEVMDVFASNRPKDDEPKREALAASDYGSICIRPSDPEWPHDDPWIEENGIRFFAIYVRGPIAKAHRDGSVTIAVTLCGPHDDSDVLINQAGPVYQWFFNEHVLKNGGTGYRNHDYGTLETFANGDPMLLTSKFTSFQDATKEYLGDGMGYTAGLAITEPTTLREIIRRSTLSHGVRWAHNHFGQVFPFVINELDNVSSGRHFRRHIEIHRPVEQLLAHDEVRNKEDYTFHWDPDGGDFRFKGYSQKNADSIAAHTPGGVSGTESRRGLREGDGEREMYYTNDPTTADDVVARNLSARARRQRYLSVPTDLTGLEYDITAPIRVTDPDGLGASGDVATPAVVLGVTIDTETSEVVLFSHEQRYVNHSFRISDATRISDSVQVSGLFPTESLAIADALAIGITSFEGLSTSVNESLRLSETIDLDTNLAASKSDSVRIIESISLVLSPLQVNISEALRLEDDVLLEDDMIRQVVNTQSGAHASGTTAMPYDDTIPQNTEGDQYMTLAITPTSATNKLKIEVAVNFAHDGTPPIAITVALFQDSTASALAATSFNQSASSGSSPITFTHYMTAGTTSATTFKIRAGGNVGATLNFNGRSGARMMGGVMASSITITEIVV